MLVFWIFLITDVSMVALFAACTRGLAHYREGMLLGVHIPPEAVECGEVQGLLDSYKKQRRLFYLGNMILAAAMSFLCFWRFSCFMVVWTVWLFEICAGIVVLPSRIHRRLYDLKVERGWFFGESVRTVKVDTRVAAESAGMALPHWYHLPALAAALLLPFVFPQIRMAAGAGSDGWILPGVLVATQLMFWAIHLWFGKGRNVVYSMDTELNYTVNRLEKRTWSELWLAAGYLNLAAFAALICPMIRKGRFDVGGMVWFVVIETVIVVVLLAGIIWLGRRRAELLAGAGVSCQVDDDVYWKNGWYSNPDNPRLFIQDRMNGMNITVNMGRRSGRILTAAVLGGTAALLVWLCALLVRIEFTPIDLQVQEDTGVVQIVSGDYAVSFDADEITELSVVDDLPDKSFYKANGYADHNMLLGKFHGHTAGNCRLYIYRGYTPVLRIRTEDYLIYINSKKAGEVARWTEELQN